MHDTMGRSPADNDVDGWGVNSVSAGSWSTAVDMVEPKDKQMGEDPCPVYTYTRRTVYSQTIAWFASQVDDTAGWTMLRCSLFIVPLALLAWARNPSMVLMKRYAGGSDCASDDIPHSIEMRDGNGRCIVDDVATDSQGGTSSRLTCNDNGASVTIRVYNSHDCSGSPTGTLTIGTEECFSFPGTSVRRWGVCGTPSKVVQLADDDGVYPLTLNAYADEDCRGVSYFAEALKTSTCIERSNDEIVKFDISKSGSTVVESVYTSGTCIGFPNDNFTFGRNECVDERKAVYRGAQTVSQAVTAFASFAGIGSGAMQSLPSVAFLLTIVAAAWGLQH